MLLVSICFLFFAKTWGGFNALTRGSIIRIGGVGILVSIHWIFFYGAIKYSNISVTLSIMATISFMTSFVEPLITKRKFRPYEALLGLLVVPGIYLIYYFSEAGHLTGMIMALLSAFFASLFTSLNKKHVEITNPYTFSFLQLFSGFLFLTLMLPIYLHYFPGSFYVGSALDYSYLFCLAFFCTLIPYILYMIALRTLDAFTTNFANNLEPVYGIVLAWIIFAENQEMDWRFYIGTTIIILSIFAQPMLKRVFDS